MITIKAILAKLIGEQAPANQHFNKCCNYRNNYYGDQLCD